MLLKGGEWLRVSPHKDEVVDVGEMTRTVKTKVGSVGDAVRSLEVGLGVEEVLVNGLGDED